MMETLRLIAGLGNPGRRYASTRHNVGFMAVDRLATRHRAVWKTESKFESKLAWIDAGFSRCVLCQPQTFMNLSGPAVRALSNFYRVPADRLLVVVDDADLRLGEVRLRENGSSGGHHGLESVEQSLGGRDFPRLRIGIGRDARERAREITGHVLGSFRPDERGTLNRVLDRVVQQIECWATAGARKAMNDFNGAVKIAPPVQQES